MLILSNIVSIALSIALAVEGAGPSTVSDGGKAVGIAQIWPITVREVNRILRYDVYSLDDRYDPEKSKDMMGIILTFHHYRHPNKDVIWLASRWRNPYSTCPEWHIRKLRRELKNLYP